MPADLFRNLRARAAKRQSDPWHYWPMMELVLVVCIVGLTISTAAIPGVGLAIFKARLSEAFGYVSSEHHKSVERIALYGGWGVEGEGPDTASAPLAIPRGTSIGQAEIALRDRGADGGGREVSKYVARLMNLGASTVALARIPEFEGAGVLAFRPAVPESKGVPPTVTPHCGGKPPAGWVAAPQRVLNNLPAPYLPWLCRDLPWAKS